MLVKDILRKEAGFHAGSVLRTIIPTTEEILYKRLRLVPNKIGAYFHRDKIKAVYREHNGKDPAYIIEATDGAKFWVEY